MFYNSKWSEIFQAFSQLHLKKESKLQRVTTILDMADAEADWWRTPAVGSDSETIFRWDKQTPPIGTTSIVGSVGREVKCKVGRWQ